MQKVNLSEVPEAERKSPGGKYQAFYKGVSAALGHEMFGAPERRHPFDLMVSRIPPGAMFCPHHAHSAQWEMYIVLSGHGTVRDESNTISEVSPGDVFVFAPGEAHQLSNNGTEDFVYYVIPDNPQGDCCHYPDSGKVAFRVGKNYLLLRGDPADYFDGEE